MKKYIKLLSLVLIFSFSSSCDEDKNDIVYDNVNGQALLQFEKTAGSIPTPADGETSFDVEVYVSTVSDVARKIELKVDSSVEDASGGDEYSLSELVIEAGSYAGVLTVTSNYDAIPEEGSSFLVIDIVSIENASKLVVKDGTLTLELFRKCPVVGGDYVVRMLDVYGDGWQGSKIIMTIDGVSTDLYLEDYWSTGIAYPGGENTVEVNVPEGTDTLTFEWVSGSYPEECFYEIFHPNGMLIFTDGDSDDYNVVPAEGEIPFNPCNF